MAGFFDDPDFPEEENDSPPAHIIWRILGKTVKYAFWAVIILINGLIFWLLFSSGTSASMKKLDTDEQLRQIYASYLSASAEDVTPFAVYQSENTRRNITDEREDKETGFPGNYGYFSLEKEIIMPYARRVQVVFRYNKSTLAALERDWGLGITPDPELDWYDVSLRIVKNDGETVRIPSLCVQSEIKNRYCYRKLVFKEIPDLDDVDEMYVDIYFVDAADYSSKPYGTLCIYDSEYKLREYKLTKSDLKALKGSSD